MVAALKAFFRLQREPNLKSGHILVIVRMLRDTIHIRNVRHLYVNKLVVHKILLSRTQV